ncbi:hypothetical protein FHG87_011176 [Trinorchestia longiramus]|nr:hypothetical protein FHG87_011176 [Trinorchestia longiramus]
MREKKEKKENKEKERKARKERKENREKKARAIHMKEHPDYKYRPRRKIKVLAKRENRYGLQLPILQPFSDPLRPFYPPPGFLSHFPALAHPPMPPPPPPPLPPIRAPPLSPTSSPSEVPHSLLQMSGHPTSPLYHPQHSPFLFHPGLPSISYPLLDPLLWNRINSSELFRIGMATSIADSSSETPTYVSREFKNNSLKVSTNVLSISNLISNQTGNERKSPIIEMSHDEQGETIYPAASRAQQASQPEQMIADSNDESLVLSRQGGHEELHRSELKARNISESFSSKYSARISAFSPAGRLLSLLPAEHPYHLLLRREFGLDGVANNDLLEMPTKEYSDSDNGKEDGEMSHKCHVKSGSRSSSPRIDIDSSPASDTAMMIEETTINDENDKQSAPGIDHSNEKKQHRHSDHRIISDSPPPYDSTNRIVGNSDRHLDCVSSCASDGSDPQLATDDEIRMSTSTPSELSSFPRFYFNASRPQQMSSSHQADAALAFGNSSKQNTGGAGTAGFVSLDVFPKNDGDDHEQCKSSLTQGNVQPDAPQIMLAHPHFIHSALVHPQSESTSISLPFTFHQNSGKN